MNRVWGALLAAVLVLGAGVAAVESNVVAASATAPEATAPEENIPNGETSPSDGSDEGAESADLPPAELSDLEDPLVSPSIIGGTATVGMPSSVDPGNWGQPGVSFTYQWLNNGNPIAGANAAEYVPAPAEMDAMLQVVVTASKEGFRDSTVETAGVVVAPGMLTSATPVISGTTAVGKTLRANLGTWSPTGTQLSLQWTRDGRTIAGATAITYVLTASDLGKRIGVDVRGSTSGYEPKQAVSAPTKTVAAGTLAAVTPKISGSAVVGKTLKASVATWAPTGTKITLQWKRNGVSISGATKSSYTLRSADTGKRITVTATGSLAGFTKSSRTSSATTAVLKAFTSTSTPRVAGSIRVGSVLTAQVPAAKPVATTVSYRWYRNGSAISGATRSTYRLTSSDAGKQVTVQVTSKRSGYASVSKTSAAHRVPMVLRAPTPKISGSAIVGSQLRASAGSWTSGTKLTYRWYRNGVAIAGAQSSSYRIGAGDHGRSLTVVVTGKKSGYTTESRTSKSTAAVKYPSRMTPSGWNCPSWAPIKGNASSMIYHVPSGAFYSRTNPEECFSTERAAQNAGYRRSQR